MSDEWQGWLHEFPSREAVEAHVAAYTPPPSASPWMTGAPWLRHHGDLTVIYLAVRDGEVRARLPNGAAWHTLEMGRAGMWRPITALGEATDGCDDARAMLREIRRVCIASVRGAEHAATLTDAEVDEHAASTGEDVACLAAQLRGAKATIAELLRADEGERTAREERWSKYLADVERLTAERDAAFNRGVEAAAKVAAECASERGHTQATMFAEGRPETAFVAGIKGGEASRIEALIRALKVAP